MAKEVSKSAPEGAASTSVATAEEAKAMVIQQNALFEQHAGAGLENVTARDILIPRITILQSNSPQVIRGKAEYNPDARPGMIFDVNMAQIIGERMLFIPLIFRMSWLEWAPRESGKGLIAIHTTSDILQKTQPKSEEDRRPFLPNGNYIAETAEFYGLNVSAENRLSFLPMASTQLKKARLLNTLATSEKVEGANGFFTPPLFYRMYQFETVPENNAKGDWLGWKIERGPRLQDTEGWQELFHKMVAYSADINEGRRKADVAGMQDEVDNTSSSVPNDNKAM